MLYLSLLALFFLFLSYLLVNMGFELDTFKPTILISKKQSLTIIKTSHTRVTFDFQINIKRPDLLSYCYNCLRVYRENIFYRSKCFG